MEKSRQIVVPGTTSVHASTRKTAQQASKSFAEVNHQGRLDKATEKNHERRSHLIDERRTETNKPKEEKQGIIKKHPPPGSNSSTSYNIGTRDSTAEISSSPLRPPRDSKRTNQRSPNRISSPDQKRLKQHSNINKERRDATPGQLHSDNKFPVGENKAPQSNSGTGNQHIPQSLFSGDDDGAAHRSEKLKQLLKTFMPRTLHGMEPSEFFGAVGLHGTKLEIIMSSTYAQQNKYAPLGTIDALKKVVSEVHAKQTSLTELPRHVMNAFLTDDNYRCAAKAFKIPTP